MTARNDSPFSPKHATIPKAVRAAPASSGPTTRARLNWMELSAIAFGKCIRFTSEGMSDWYAGPAKRLGHAGDDRERQDVPDLNDVEIDEHGQSERGAHLHALRDQK